MNFLRRHPLLADCLTDLFFSFLIALLIGSVGLVWYFLVYHGDGSWM